MVWRGLTRLQNGEPGFDQLHRYVRLEIPKVRSADGHELQRRDARPERLHDSSCDRVIGSSQFPVIADIGGGIGAQLSNILDAHPSCQGFLSTSRRWLRKRRSMTACTCRGRLLRGNPGTATPYLLRWIIHDWADDKAITILGT